MRVGSGPALSTSQSAWEAATEAAHAARGRDTVDLAFLLLSPAHLDEVEAAAEAVQ